MRPSPSLPPPSVGLLASLFCLFIRRAYFSSRLSFGLEYFSKTLTSPAGAGGGVGSGASSAFGRALSSSSCSPLSTHNRLRKSRTIGRTLCPKRAASNRSRSMVGCRYMFYGSVLACVRIRVGMRVCTKDEKVGRTFQLQLHVHARATRT